MRDALVAKLARNCGRPLLLYLSIRYVSIRGKITNAYTTDQKQPERENPPHTITITK